MKLPDMTNLQYTQQVYTTCRQGPMKAPVIMVPVAGLTWKRASKSQGSCGGRPTVWIGLSGNSSDAKEMLAIMEPWEVTGKAQGNIFHSD